MISPVDRGPRADLVNWQSSHMCFWVVKFSIIRLQFSIIYFILFISHKVILTSFVESTVTIGCGTIYFRWGFLCTNPHCGVLIKGWAHCVTILKSISFRRSFLALVFHLFRLLWTKLIFLYCWLFHELRWFHWRLSISLYNTNPLLINSS